MTAITQRVQRNVATTNSMFQRIYGIELFILLLWPLLLIVINHNWLFLNTGVDDWMYFGYFNNLQEHLNRFSGIKFYYGTRLPWIIPGAILYSVFPPLVANYILHIGMYYIVVLSIYTALAILLHRRTAVVIAMLLGSYSYFLVAIGSDYVNGAGIAYFCLSVLFVVLAWKSRYDVLYLVLAGAAAAATIFTNLFNVSLMPGLIVLCFWLLYKSVRQFIVYRLVPLIAGALATMTFFGFVNVALGGEFLFFGRSIWFASYTTQLTKNPWIEGPTDWPIREPHLIYPIIVLVACVLCLAIPAIRRGLRVYPMSIALIDQFLITAAVMIAFQLRPSTPILQAYFYASYTMPAMFLALGALLALPLAKVNTGTYIATVLSFALIELGAFAFRSCWGWQDTTLPVLTLGLLWVLVLVALYRFAYSWLYAVLVVTFGTFIATVPSAFTISSNQFSFCMVDSKAQQPLEDNYLTVLRSVTIIKSIARGAPVYFWYNLEEQQLYSSVAGFYLGPWVNVGEHFPAMSEADYERAAVDSTLVILSKEPNVLPFAEATLRVKDQTATLLGQEQMLQDRVQFFITVIRVDPVSEKASQETEPDPWLQRIALKSASSFQSDRHALAASIEQTLSYDRSRKP